MDFMLHAYNFKYLYSMPLNMMVLKYCTLHAKSINMNYLQKKVVEVLQNITE